MKASSLFYSVIIALLLAIISSSLILYSYYHKIHFNQYQIDHQLRLNAESGLRLLMEDHSVISADEPFFIDLYDQGSDSVLLIKKEWGISHVCISSASRLRKKYTLIAETGIRKSDNIAFYLENHQRPLYASGSTLFTGDCFLPGGELKRAYINGKGFDGEPVKGTIKKSEENLPGLRSDLVNRINDLFEVNSGTDSLIGIEETDRADTFTNSFLNNTLVIYSKDAIILQGKRYSGNIRIVSEKKIVVNDDVSLEDVIIAAPKIEIKENFEGVLQAYASDTLTVGKDCSLLYPSVLGLIRKNKSAEKIFMIIDEGCEIKGTVIGINKGAENKTLLISIRPDVKITGLVYSNNYLDLKGEVEGSVWCSKMILYTPAAIYENHVLDLKINAKDLAKEYVHPWLFESSSEKRKAVSKWLR
jgi:hypothetical protein